MTQIKVFCEICREELGTADTDTLKEPMIGKMFTSRFADRGIELFYPTIEWQHMLCPYCRKRPFVLPDRVMMSMAGEMFIFSEGYHKPEDEKSLYERNQEAINEQFDEYNGYTAEFDNNTPNPEKLKSKKWDYTGIWKDDNGK